MKEDEIAIRANKSIALDKKLKEGLKTIDEKLKKLGVTQTNAPFKTTNTNFKYNENDSNVINIMTCGDAAYLLKALAMLERVKTEYEDTAKNLELVTYPVCTWLGLPIDYWIHDLTIRVKLVINNQQIVALTKAKTDLTAFLSQEDRLTETLGVISKLLK